MMGRFSLGFFVLALATLVASAAVGQTCSNGMSGVEAAGVCCKAECGTCGGTGCSTRVPGFGQYDCCVGPIVDNWVLCSVSGRAPCIVDEVVERCSNGVPGVEAASVCCREGCGTCGGTGCSTRVPGFGQYDCCVGPIVDTGVSCGDSVAAPCIIDEDVERCSNGVPGVESTGICCREECGTCGGTGCSTRVPGFGQYDCCVGPISRTGASCGDSVAAPCIIGEDVSRCSNGVTGVDGAFNTCCKAECGLCDASDCAGQGHDDCCVAAILASGVSCGTSVEAPCIKG